MLHKQYSKINTIQRELFSILNEFFERATGSSYSTFAPLTEFTEKVRRNAEHLAMRGYDAFNWGLTSLAAFYQRHGMELFRASKELGGIKLVLGGGRFTVAHLDAIRKMLLYVDTVLIPDPVLPWVESERSEEHFRHVLFLQTVFTLLHLKPLIDADIPYPGVVVFPSWEKSLENKDEQTQQGSSALVTQFISFYLGKDFEAEDQVIDYVDKNESEFLNVVEQKQLLVAPEGAIGEPIREAIDKYRASINLWRSKEFVSVMESQPDGLFVWYALNERLTPQYHLLENAEELMSQPMLCHPVHWHYYSLCATMYEGRLVQKSLLDSKTVSILRSLNEPRFQWLGNVPVNALVELRKNNENEDFRTQLDKYTKQLHESSISDLNRVAAEVGRGIVSLLATHQRLIREIEQDYKLLHKQTAIGAWVTFAATLIPSLAPFVVTAAPPAILGKYLWDKAKEVQEKKKAVRSLMGVLADANENER